MLKQIKTRYWALLAMLLWGGFILITGMLRFDNFGLDEGGAMALLLGWSVSDQIATPIALYGGPDFRALPFYIILGLYWPGSMMAAKVFSLLVMYASAMFLYLWSRDNENSEVALLATGLLLIAPATLMQVDSLSVGPYLLLLFGSGAILDQKYRQSLHSISSLYFVQMLLVAFACSLHPAGLAYPITLAWIWFKNPTEAKKQQKFIWIGTATAVFVVLVMQTGWIALNWFGNLLYPLNDALIGRTPLDLEQGWITGSIALALLVTVCLRDFKNITDNFFASLLFSGILIGALAADGAWALLVLALLLYRGIPHIIAINRTLTSSNFAGQRGIVMAALMITSIVFMSGDKAITTAIKSEVLSTTDQLIQTLSLEAQDKDNAFFAASQWPARTMMACQRDTYRLPPAKETGEALIKSMKGITHIIFNHNDPSNTLLAKNLAEVSALTKTLSIQDGGVIIKVQQSSAEAKKPAQLPDEHAKTKDSDLPIQK